MAFLVRRELRVTGDLTSVNGSRNETLHCDEGALLGLFGLIVQALLALAAFMLLICKCYKPT